jgi:outer membrane protein OmpA-like peptidoglycan-associated protein
MPTRAQTIGAGALLVAGSLDLVFVNVWALPRLRPRRAAAPLAVAAADTPAPPAPAASPPAAQPTPPSGAPHAAGDVPPGADRERLALVLPFAANHPAFDQPTAQALARLARAAGGGRIVVEGHSDRRGDRWLNHQLSRARAEAVARELEALGVPPGAIVVRALGATRLLSEGRTDRDHARNRRVEVRVLKGAP